MLHGHRPAHSAAEEDDDIEFRDIHALTPTPSPHSHPSSSQGRRLELWEAGSHRSSSLSLGGAEAIGEAFSTMTRELSTMVVAGNTMQNNSNSNNAAAAAASNGGHSNSTAGNGGNFHDEPNLSGIGEELLEETNPLAIVPDSNPMPSPRRAMNADLAATAAANSSSVEDVPLHVVKMEEVESKISAWQTAEIAKINNRFKREEVVINGWEGGQVDKAAAWLKKVERKLEKQRARAMEKMQNDVAQTRRKAEEKRALAEAKRGTKVGKVLELAHLMRAMGRAPSKRSFF